MVASLAGCNRIVDELYGPNAFNTGSFMGNYYYGYHDGVDKIEVSEENVHTYTVTPFVLEDNYVETIPNLREEDQLDSDGNTLSFTADYPNLHQETGYGPYYSLIKYDSAFSYGHISKLYDGRLRCDGFQARSRVQLDKTGYSTYFPKALNTYKYFAFALRGGTDDDSLTFKQEIDDPDNPGKKKTITVYPELDIHISFYKHDTNTGVYSKYVFNINDMVTQSNNHGNTSFVHFYFDTVLGEGWETMLKDTIAMSFTFELKHSIYDDLTDDKNDESKVHFAVMLYEIMFPGSTWY